MRILSFMAAVAASLSLFVSPTLAQQPGLSQASKPQSEEKRKPEVPKKLAIFQVDVSPNMQWTNLINAVTQEMFSENNSIRIASDEATKKVMLYGDKDQVEKIASVVDQINVPAEQLPVGVKLGDRAELIKIPTDQVGRVTSVCTNLGLPVQSYRLGDHTYLRVEASQNETVRTLLNELLENR